MNDNKEYNAIFVCTGSSNRECNAYLIDRTNTDILNTYHWILPPLLVQCMGASVLYSNKYGLIEIGGYSKQCFSLLPFNNKSLALNWENIDKWSKPRGYIASSFINEDLIICCGGFKNGYVDCADIYNLKQKKWIKISDMKQARCRSGIYVDKINKQRVFIGGGKIRVPMKKFECYDINKNIWTLLSDTIGYHCADPLIWMDNPNIINIISSFCKIWEQMDLRENKWKIKTGFFDNPFGKAVKSNSFGCRLLADLYD